MLVTEPVTEQRLERALVTLAYVMTVHGTHYLPLFDRIEREITTFRTKQDPMSRAKLVLERHTVPATRAIA
jgi:hypothetical protein